MKKIKQFLSPVVGGHYDGYTFKEFMKSPQRWFLLILFPIAFIGVPIFAGPDSGWDPEWSFYGVEAFLFLVWCLFIYKGIIQHWDDMKKHRSR